MSTTSEATPSASADRRLDRRTDSSLASSELIRTFAAAAATAAAYYLTARLGRALAFPAVGISTLWLPNAILLSALLLNRRRDWWIFFVAVLPAHLLAPATAAGMSPVRPLVSYLLNCATALIAGVVLQRFLPRIARIDRTRTAVGLILGGLVAGITTSFFSSAVVAMFGGEAGHWLMPLVRALTNAFAIVAVVPLVLHAASWVRQPRHTIRPGRVLEAILLTAVLAGVGVLAFVMPDTAARNPAVLLYAPFALLLWATVRFGVVGACGSVLLIGVLACWGISSQTGPFVTENALSVELFLALTSATLLLLAATLEERRDLEQEGRASESRFRTVFDHNIIPTVIYHTDGRVLDANESFLRLTGYDRAAFEGGQLRAETLLRAPSGAGGLARVGFDTSSPVERELLLRDGHHVPVLVGGYLFAGSSRGTAYLFDLSSVRRAERERHQAELLHWAILASVHDQIVVLNQSGVVIEANQSWRHLVEGTTMHAFEKADLGDNYLNDCERATQAGDVVAGELLAAMRETLGGLSVRRRLEYAHNGDAEPAWYEISIERLRRPEGGIVIRRTDITAQKQAMEQARDQRQQLAHLGRAAVLGELSGAFAHELAQPLTSILGNAEAALQVLLREAGDQSELHEMLRDIIRDDIRAAELLKRLRSMLMRGEIQRQSVDLNQVVRDVLALTRSDLITRNVSVTMELDPQPCVVQADSVQLQQVLLNLIVNACEAMAEIPVSERRLVIATRPTPNGRAIECSVADRGTGIAAADLERIFQPFVTSKKRGLGLGLPICRSIIEAHGGRLWAEPGLDHGAMLRFTANTLA